MIGWIVPACRRRMFVRSFSTAKDSTCKTMSLRNVPTRSFPRRVSNKGISGDTMLSCADAHIAVYAAQALSSDVSWCSPFLNELTEIVIARMMPTPHHSGDPYGRSFSFVVQRRLCAFLSGNLFDLLDCQIRSLSHLLI